MDHQEYYQHIDRLSLFYHYYAFLDTEEYLADQLFIKHQVRVHFREEYARKDSQYLLCTLGQSAPRRKEGGVRL